MAREALEDAARAFGDKGGLGAEAAAAAAPAQTRAKSCSPPPPGTPPRRLFAGDSPPGRRPSVPW
eukprot:6674335-Alexandrium_andersonii.AAC.1